MMAVCPSIWYNLGGGITSIDVATVSSIAWQTLGLGRVWYMKGVRCMSLTGSGYWYSFQVRIRTMLGHRVGSTTGTTGVPVRGDRVAGLLARPPNGNSQSEAIS